jgi:V/A-type H+-transporting ATPase subunit E
VALADIVRRIEQDAQAEADTILLEADRAAGELRSAAERRAQAARDRIIERARADSQAEARTRLASARLLARDRLLAVRGDLVRRAIAMAVGRLEEQPDATYASLLAKHVARSAGAEVRIVVGEADEVRLRAHLPGALARAGVPAEVEGSTEALERGVLLLGERMQVEVSARSLVEAEADRLRDLAVAILFGDRADRKEVA